MTDLDRYNAVNKCETLDELSKVILSFADPTGQIQGRQETFDAAKMALACTKLGQVKNKIMWPHYSRALTRNWGIRQQALYILTYQQ